MKYDIEFYEDKDGYSEVYEYINELNKNNKDSRIKLKKVSMYIELLSKYGLTLTEPYIKKISENIWELRPLRDRILFASWYNNKFVLLSLFMKQTQKTPKSEIERAQKLLEDYKNRSD